MPDEAKITFQLTAREPGRLEVRVNAPGGEARGETDMPDAALLDAIGAQDPAHISAALVERTGQALYSALVSESVDEVVVDTLNDSMRAGQPAQFELRFDPDQVALTRWPWEMIQNVQGQFVVRDGLVDLTRYITYPQPPPSFDRTFKGLPLFRVISMPPTLPPLSANPLGIQPIEILEHATFEAFMRRLLVDRLALWGIQFDGHGALVLQCAKCDTLNDPKAQFCWKCGKSLAEAKPVGALAFEKNGDVNWIPTAEFGSVLYNAHVRLALLLACETAAVGGKLVFSGLAPGLLLAGVPAVIGMQYPVLDSFANSFANEFYGALGRDGDLLTAVRIARRMNMLGAWYSPALYLRRQPTAAEQADQPVYLTRNIDTAAPARVSAGVPFLVRLWIRRPETKPLSAAKLRDELDIPKDVPVRQRKGEAEVKFEPMVGRRLRRGEVEVTLVSTGADVMPPRMKLFIDETLDAPPAIFTVRAQALGNLPLIFSVIQNGGVIHTVTHVVEAVAGYASREVAEHSQAVDLEGEIRKPATGRFVAIMEGPEEEEKEPQKPEPAPSRPIGGSPPDSLRDVEIEPAEPTDPAKPQAPPQTGGESSPPYGEATGAESKSVPPPPPQPAPAPAIPMPAQPPVDRRLDDAKPPAEAGEASPPPVPRMEDPGHPASAPGGVIRGGTSHPMAETYTLAVRAYTVGDVEHAAVLLRQCVDGGLSSPEVVELLRRAEAAAEQRRFGGKRSAGKARRSTPLPIEPEFRPGYTPREQGELSADEDTTVSRSWSAPEKSAYKPIDQTPSGMSTESIDRDQIETARERRQIDDYGQGYGTLGQEEWYQQDGQAPQDSPYAPPATIAPHRKSSGFPIWLVIGGLLLLLCAVVGVMIVLTWMAR